MIRRLLRPLLGTPVSRRAILSRIARFGVLASTAPALAAAVEKDESELRALATLIRELVPHAVDEAVYVDAARAIRGAMTITPQQVDDGLQRLRSATSGNLPEDAFLVRMRTAAVEAIYRDPRVWDLIGYGGNALAKGGYTASYNDIDWLPGAKK